MVTDSQAGLIPAEQCPLEEAGFSLCKGPAFSPHREVGHNPLFLLVPLSYRHCELWREGCRRAFAYRDHCFSTTAQTGPRAQAAVREWQPLSSQLVSTGSSQRRSGAGHHVRKLFQSHQCPGCLVNQPSPGEVGNARSDAGPVSAVAVSSPPSTGAWCFGDGDKCVCVCGGEHSEVAKAYPEAPLCSASHMPSLASCSCPSRAGCSGT
ncbi:unnamed protein product [Natator depressus]